MTLSRASAMELLSSLTKPRTLQAIGSSQLILFMFDLRAASRMSELQ